MSTGSPTGTVSTAHASGLGGVVRELGELHRAMLRAGGDEEAAVRLSVMTLVVVCTDRDEMTAAGAVVARISAQHPARALMVLAEPEGEPGITADLRLECGIGGRDAGVCAELIDLRVGGDAARHLGSVVTPLLLPDVPVHLWLPGAPRLEQPLSDETLAICERVVLDSGLFPDVDATLARLAEATARRSSAPVVDLTWLRLTPWRELVARAFDATARRPLLVGVDAVEVHGAAAAARLMGGWLRSRLGLDAGRVTITVVPDAAGPVERVLIHSTAAGGSSMSVERDDDALRTHVMVGGETVATRSVPLDQAELTDLVGAALQEGGADAVYAAALQAATAPA